jgi:hypothetical protein
MTRIVRYLPILLIVLICSSSLTAQEIRVGALEGNSQVFFGAQPLTVIDWSRPATASGTVNTASIAWTGAITPCDSIFFVRFYAIPSNAFVTVMTNERGPFRAVTGINTVTLEPPVSVTTETYIGIRRAAGPDTCGQPYGTFTRQPGRALFTSDDFKNGSITALSPAANFRLQAQASNVPSVRVSTIPAVGALAGSNGSFFRTSLALANPGAIEIRGKLLYHPTGHSATDSDPSLSFVIPPNGTLNYPDVVATLGQSGLGSLDILTTASPTPIATARVFNDLGSAGTNGAAEDAVPAGPDYLSTATVLIPQDLTNFRLNVGVRTIDAADLNIVVYDAAGLQQGTTVKSYAANFFEQVAASQLTGGTLPPGGRIVVSAFSKEFIVYGSITDNRTNDPTIRIGSD